MGLTPVLKLPWPEATDPADGPAAFQALANRVELTQGAGVVTSLPGTPVDGQIVYFRTGAAGSPVWALQWSTADARWYKVGGAPLYQLSAGSFTVSAAFPAWMQIAPAIAIPRAGLYRYHFGYEIQLPGASALAYGYGTISGPGVAQATLVETTSVTVQNQVSPGGLPREQAFTGAGTIQCFQSTGVANGVNTRARVLTVDAVYLT